MSVEAADLAIASELCKLVDAPDLITWLGLAPGCSPEEAAEALQRERKRMQAMQNNPKYRDAARFLLKKYAALRRVAEEPESHRTYTAQERENEKVPMLAVAIDGVLADGALSPTEEAFVRKQAVRLGISTRTFERVLAERVAAAGLDLEGAREAGAADARAVAGADGYAWWDPEFTRILLGCIPQDPGLLIDMYCRTGLTARTLLPERPSMRWIGVDRDPRRIEEARREFPQDPRVRFAFGHAHALPVEDGKADVILGVRALANMRRISAVLFEAGRALREGGRLVLVEPDGYAETFLFDGHLYAYNVAFRRLCAKVDEIAAEGVAPYDRAGMALGPQLSRRIEAHGFDVAKVAVHAAYSLKERRFEPFAARLRRYPAAIAAAVGFRSDEPEVRAVLREVDQLERRLQPNTTGLAGHVLPMFIAVGVRPAGV